MPKFFVRFIALLLVPCLLADHCANAYASIQPASQIAPITHSSTLQGSFSEQALAASPVAATHYSILYARLSVRIQHLVSPVQRIKETGISIMQGLSLRPLSVALLSIPFLPGIAHADGTPGTGSILFVVIFWIVVILFVLDLGGTYTKSFINLFRKSNPDKPTRKGPESKSDKPTRKGPGPKGFSGVNLLIGIAATSAAALGFLLPLVAYGHNGVATDTGFLAHLASCLSAVPWWGWGLGGLGVSFFGRLSFLIFSPIQRIRWSARIKLGFFPEELKPFVRQFGSEPFLAIAQASREVAEFAFGALARNKDLVVRYGIAPFVAITQASGRNAGYTFNGLAKAKNLIARYGIAPFVAIAQASKDNAEDAFVGLAQNKELIARFGIEPFVAIAQASGREAKSAFKGLAWVVDQVKNAEDLGVYARGFVVIARGSYYAEAAFGALAKNKDLLERYGIAPFVEIAQASGGFAEHAFQGGLPMVRDLIKSLNDLKAYGQALAAITQAVGSGAWGAFHDLSQNKDLLARYGIAPFVAIAQASGVDAASAYIELAKNKDLLERYRIAPFVEIAKRGVRG